MRGVSRDDVSALTSDRSVANLERINQLFNVRGADTSTVRYLLSQESNTQTLLNQVGREYTNDLQKIKNLYKAGATSEEITGLLQVQRRADILYQYMQTKDANFSPENLQFASLHDNKVGSIYLQGNRRIRLVHNSAGPNVKDHSQAHVEKYTLDNADAISYEAWKKENKTATFTEIYDQVTNYNSVRPAVVNQGAKLFEFFAPNGAAGYHASRGRPVPVNQYGLNQNHLNILYNVSTDAGRRIQEKENLVKLHEANIKEHQDAIAIIEEAEERLKVEQGLKQTASEDAEREYRKLKKQRNDIKKVLKQKGAIVSSIKAQATKRGGYTKEEADTVRRETEAAKVLQARGNRLGKLAENAGNTRERRKEALAEVDEKLTKLQEGYADRTKSIAIETESKKSAKKELKTQIKNENKYLNLLMGAHPVLGTIPVVQPPADEPNQLL